MHWCAHAALAPHTSLYAMAHGSIIIINYCDLGSDVPPAPIKKMC